MFLFLLAWIVRRHPSLTRALEAYADAVEVIQRSVAALTQRSRTSRFRATRYRSRLTGGVGHTNVRRRQLELWRSEHHHGRRERRNVASLAALLELQPLREQANLALHGVPMPPL
jgi:hypothetical protein